MARIAGVDLPKNKRIFVALGYIYGIGRKNTQRILQVTKIDPQKVVKDLTESEINTLREEIEKNYKVEGELRTEISINIKKLKDIQSYRGQRHIRNLPVRGQRTHTNARTHKGARPRVGGGKRVSPTTTPTT